MAKVYPLGCPISAEDDDDDDDNDNGTQGWMNTDDDGICRHESR